MYTNIRTEHKTKQKFKKWTAAVSKSYEVEEKNGPGTATAIAYYSLTSKYL